MPHKEEEKGSLGFTVLFLAVLLGVAAVVFAIWSGFGVEFEAECNLHAIIVTVQVLEEYLHQNNGKWPSSWEDLFGVSVQSDSMFKWPKHNKEVKDRVILEFGQDVRAIISRGKENFRAVRPVGVCYEWKGELDSLWNKLKEGEGSAPPPPDHPDTPKNDDESAPSPDEKDK